MKQSKKMREEKRKGSEGRALNTATDCAVPEITGDQITRCLTTSLSSLFPFHRSGDSGPPAPSVSSSLQPDHPLSLVRPMSLSPRSSLSHSSCSRCRVFFTITICYIVGNHSSCSVVPLVRLCLGTASSSRPISFLDFFWPRLLVTRRS
jgi:hypothetical protein